MPAKRIDNQPGPDGLYRYSLRYYVDGKRFMRHRRFATDAEAEAWIDRQRAEGADGLRWSACVRQWAESTGNSENYIYKVETTIRRLTERIGDIPVDATTHRQVSDYIEHVRRAVSHSQARHDLKHLKSVARWARSENKIQKIQFEHVRKPRPKETPKRPVPLDEIGPLIDALDKWLTPVVLWITLTGCRQQDAATLTADHVHADRVTLHVKGGDPVDYPLDDNLQAVLDMAGTLKTSHGLRSRYVFVNSVGSRWTTEHLARRVRVMWGPDCPYTLHSLRHAFSTLAGQHYDPDALKAILGHKSRATSERYTQLERDLSFRRQGGSTVRNMILPHLPPKIRNGINNGIRRDKTSKTTQDDQSQSNLIEVCHNGHNYLLPKDLIDKLRQGKV